jgi:two-component system, LytTR family, response regulator
MKALVIDNEETVRMGLVEMIELFCPQIDEIETAVSVVTGVEHIQKYRPDILFLDVELDDGTGFDILSQLSSMPFQLIFTTAHNQYAIKAFQFSALDYLLKPINPELLRNSVQKAAQNVRNNDLQLQLQILMQQLAMSKEMYKKIVLKDSNSTYFVKLDDIIFCQAEGTYTKFYIKDSAPILISKNLKEYESLLEPLGFLRTHHSYLVNPEKIKTYEKKESGSLVVEGDHLIPVSKRKKDFILKILEMGFSV